MVKVELDVFSGRPNPEWLLDPKEEDQLFARLEAEPTLMIPLNTDTGGLGYRGYIISILKEEDEASDGPMQKLRTKLRLPGGAQFPSSFRVGGVHRRGAAADVSAWLLDTSEKPDTGVNDFLREVALSSIRQPEPPAAAQLSAPGVYGAGMTCASNYLTSSTDFSFWNGASYMPYNNCYNYAANHRTNTFAQPGRYVGRTFVRPPSCSSVSTGAIYDGWRNNCQYYRNLSICLVIAPQRGLEDFHFYRKCSSGRWCHKPGKTAARNTDNSGKYITNPETCDRGNYANFCGYYYADNSIIRVK